MGGCWALVGRGAVAFRGCVLGSRRRWCVGAGPSSVFVGGCWALITVHAAGPSSPFDGWALVHFHGH